MFNIDHFLFFGLLYLVSFVFLLIKPSYIRNHFWRSSLLFIVTYTVVVGCRYGWGHDYFAYYTRYYEQHFKIGSDYGYYLLNSFEKFLGLTFEEHILLCCFFYVFCSFYLIRKTGVANAYMLTLFLPVTLMYSTYAIRQYLAISFIYLFIGFVIFDENNKKFKLLRIAIIITLLLAAYLIHAGSIAFAIPFFVFLKLKNVKVLPYNIGIIGYLIVILFTNVFSSFFNDIIGNYITILSFDNHFQSYVENSEIWFGEDAENESVYGYRGIYQVFSYLSNIGIIYLCGKSLSIFKNRNISILYNFYVIFLIVREIFFTQEIMRRIIDPFVILFFIPLGYAVYIFLKSKLFTKTKYKYIYYVIIVLSLFGVYYPQFKFLISFAPADFIWNH